jgi:hypothetical protein
MEAKASETKHTPRSWTCGQGGRGITGPSTPAIRDPETNLGPFCGAINYEVITVPFTGMLKDCNEVVAVVPEVSSGDYKANAHLIAAAPELLAALEAMILCMGHHFDSEFVMPGDEEAYLNAKAAIAKARR